MQDTSLDFLILGAGWSSTFLIPLLRAREITFAATTRDGRDVAGAKTIKWSFDPEEKEKGPKTNHKTQFSDLPRATTLLISFPLKGEGQSRTLAEGYAAAHDMPCASLRLIQLGSSGIWQGVKDDEQRPEWPWITRRSRYVDDGSNSRVVAEDELLGLGCGCVLNLAGLWGGSRDPRQWVDRVAKSKEDVAGKKSLHLVHGVDVARGVVAVSQHWKAARGQRWMLTDGFVYDWWSLFLGWADVGAEGGKEEEGEEVRQPSKQAAWTYELMHEQDVRALPRSMKALGRCYDSREFWNTFGLTPLKARV